MFLKSVIFRTSISRVMKKTGFLLWSLFSFGALVSRAQIKIGNDVNSMHPYSLLELQSDTQGVLFVRMDTATRDEAFSRLIPPVGLFIFNTDSQSLEIFTKDPLSDDMGRWVRLSSEDFLQPQIDELDAELLELKEHQIGFKLLVEELEGSLSEFEKTFQAQSKILSSTLSEFPKPKSIDGTHLGIENETPESLLVYRNGTWTVLPPGSAGQVLQLDPSQDLAWVTPTAVGGGSASATPSLLSDSDGDTQLLVETLPDEDQIRFQTQGVARAVINSSGSMGIGTSDPHPSALLDIASASLGLLLPRINRRALADLIATATSGLLVYCTDCTPQGFYGFVEHRFVNPLDGTVFQPPTTIGTVTSLTRRVWLDRNLGADRIAISSTDALAYGTYYQWGRPTDGHELVSSTTTSTLASSTIAGHDYFIKTNSSPNDWLLTHDDTLWQSTSPCPTGFRIPTEAEWRTERDSWNSNNAAGAFSSVLKLPLAGYRHRQSGTLTDPGTTGRYWSRTTNGANVRRLSVTLSSGSIANISRAYGYSIRCIAE